MVRLWWDDFLSLFPWARRAITREKLSLPRASGRPGTRGRGPPAPGPPRVSVPLLSLLRLREERERERGCGCAVPRRCPVPSYRALKLSSRHLFPSPPLSPLPLSLLNYDAAVRPLQPNLPQCCPARERPYPAARSGVPLLRRRRRRRWSPNQQLRSDALRRREAPVRGEVSCLRAPLLLPPQRREPRDLRELDTQVSTQAERLAHSANTGTVLRLGTVTASIWGFCIGEGAI